MSQITLIVIAYNRIKVAQAHWRTIKLLIEHGFDAAWNEEPLTPDLDAGYILLDLEQKIAVNGQRAFNLRVGREWTVISQ